jgi:hypothetical protein
MGRSPSSSTQEEGNSRQRNSRSEAPGTTLRVRGSGLAIRGSVRAGFRRPANRCKRLKRGWLQLLGVASNTTSSVSHSHVRLGRSLALPGASPSGACPTRSLALRSLALRSLALGSLALGTLARPAHCTAGEILLLTFRLISRFSRAKFDRQPTAFPPVPSYP